MTKAIFWLRRAFLLSLCLCCLAVNLAFEVQKSQCELSDERVQPVFTVENSNLPGLSRDGNKLIVVPKVGATRIFELHPKLQTADFLVTDSDSYAISSDGKRLAVFGGQSGASSVSIFEIESKKEQFKGSTMIRRDGIVANLQVFSHAGQLSRNISEDLKLVAIAPARMVELSKPSPSVIVGDLQTLRVVQEFHFGDTLMKDFWEHEAMTPDASLVAASRHNIDRPERSVTVVWDVNSGKERLRLPFSSEWLVLADNGCCIVTRRKLASGFATEAWDLTSGSLIVKLKDSCDGRQIRMSAAAISPDGKILATAGTTHLLLWDLQAGRLAASREASESNGDLVKAVGFSGNGDYVTVGVQGQVVKVWRLSEILYPQEKHLALW